MNRKLLLAVPLLAALPLTACSKAHSPQAEASASAVKASAKAFAASAQGQKDKKEAGLIGTKCFPHTLPGQVKAVKVLVEPTKGKAAREQLDTCAGIPKAQQPAFDAAATKAGEDALIAEAHHHKGSVTTLVETTLPNLAVQYGAQ